MTTPSQPQQLRDMVESQLEPGERITWMDQPIPNRLALRTALPGLFIGILMIPAAIFLLVSGGFLVLIALHTGSVVPWGILLIEFLVGLSVLQLLASPCIEARKAKQIVYALTDRRAIVLARGGRGAVSARSFTPEQLTNLKSRPHADRAGDLIFNCEPYWLDGEQYSREVGFLAIPELGAVEQMVKALVDRTQMPGRCAVATL